jgi:hypothetical protein
MSPLLDREYFVKQLCGSTSSTRKEVGVYLELLNLPGTPSIEYEVLVYRH